MNIQLQQIKAAANNGAIVIIFAKNDAGDSKSWHIAAMSGRNDYSITFKSGKDVDSIHASSRQQFRYYTADKFKDTMLRIIKQLPKFDHVTYKTVA